jgi:hypothetical protein
LGALIYEKKIHRHTPNPYVVRPTLPANLQQEITQFVIDGFAKKYFSTHKKGLFRRKVPMEEMLQWTKVQYNTVFDERSSNFFFRGM